MPDAISWARDHFDACLADLVECLRIPSVGTRAEHRDDTVRCAQWLADRLRRLGLDDVRAEPTGGMPMVTGRHVVDASRPTLLVYGHYDVQPPDPLERWTSPPFEPTVRDGAVYARGAVDDKGQLLVVLSALRALVESGEGLPVNLAFAIEGEEEAGSESLRPFLQAHRDALRADAALVCDTSMVDADTPAITASLRGLAYAQVDLCAGRRDLHSGAFGGTVVNVLHVLGELVASLHDGAGRVAVEGFYDDVAPPPERALADLAASGFDEDAWRAASGQAIARVEAGWSLPEANALRPCLDVNGVWGGYVGDGAKTVIPHAAGLKLSARLVARQEPDRILDALERAVRARVPLGVDVTFKRIGTAHPVMVDLDAPAVRAACAALAETFGREPVPLYGGGSIPAVAMFREVLGVEPVMMGFGLRSDNLHAPDEHFGLDRMARGIEAVIRFVRRLGGCS